MRVTSARTPRGIPLASLVACGAMLLGACRGETVYLGDDPDADRGRDGGAPDAEPCRARGDCESDERPYCNPGSRRCVECLDDWQCESGVCRNEAWAGECVPPP